MFVDEACTCGATNAKRCMEVQPCSVCAVIENSAPVSTHHMEVEYCGMFRSEALDTDPLRPPRVRHLCSTTKALISPRKGLHVRQPPRDENCHHHAEERSGTAKLPSSADARLYWDPDLEGAGDAVFSVL